MGQTEMITTVDGGLRVLRPLADQLNAETDCLDKALRGVEERLVAMGIATEVWCDESVRETLWQDVLGYSHDPTGELEYRHLELGFCQLGNEWGLGIRVVRLVKTFNSYGGEYLQTFDSGSRIEPLLTARRELRLAAVSALPGLIYEITKAVEGALQTVRVAQALADSFGHGA